MNKKIAVISFVAICLILALLLLVNLISFSISGIIFAIALILLGSFSGGFRNRK